ncbi:DUF134 domain-containing protein [Carboxylicivirga caseinilyticus]|uniref:DUF134 domain-containing protein n=1 Tax=Carboxylicivirga caseinilyticus TaxID=3417572 RepID=UPI003D34FD71|nr:DUF134 domain-containing protein [Marinilabiliaceae bacterium A049]
MPRRRRLRKIVAPPGFKGYKPYGHRPNSKMVELLYEEYEAIKLADYDLLNQLEASKLMGISRATFARIYESARRKIAEALVETKEIKTVYGNAHMDENWYVCNQCHARFNLPDPTTASCCPMCKSDEINNIITND